MGNTSIKEHHSCQPITTEGAPDKVTTEDGGDDPSLRPSDKVSHPCHLCRVGSGRLTIRYAELCKYKSGLGDAWDNEKALPIFWWAFSYEWREATGRLSN